MQFENFHREMYQRHGIKFTFQGVWKEMKSVNDLGFRLWLVLHDKSWTDNDIQRLQKIGVPILTKEQMQKLENRPPEVQ